MNVILVGGSGDGTRIVLRDGEMRHDVPVRTNMGLDVDLSPEHIQYAVHRYNLFRLHPVTRAVIFAHDELTPTQIMEKLLDGYRPVKATS